ncbi:hypothetical protein THAOC_05200 [Thalassiosira oceanica]|uniref:Uncharacterized protein n=1 Tax=Thalassiosira oceanica TaxID=159749 RepID=K0T800_THAOC|nr:hypothetical protein THAOC_05200 [Thalassiosira oceanica]|eukprot:EJK73189.1 hypothetical protein THAOC_05200 [Thalassiosira oceanica]
MTPLDLEQSAPLRRRQPNSSGGGVGAGAGSRPIAPPPSDLPPHHPLQLAKRSAIISRSTPYGVSGWSQVAC